MNRRKVLAYITRNHDQETEVLVFRRLDQAGAPLEVPGGTVGATERPEEALYRQIEEETGLVHFRFLGQIHQERYSHPAKREKQERFLFHLISLESPSDRWIHQVRSFGKDDGERLELFWMPAKEAMRALGYGQGKGILHLQHDLVEVRI